MNSKELCLRILSAESEDAVSAIIDEVPELSDPANWYPIDGRETNFNVVTNQASTGSKALTELCTNMVDAMLLKHAHLNGIVPTGPGAPKSVTDAVRDLVRLKGARSGVLAEVDDEKYLREFAEKSLVIGITGSTRRGESLCFTFTDNGEGQHPDDFEDTFLSLSKGNKSNIPFVQGKYNMGSSGVLTYCGNHWYKLIVSRRYDATGEWGWTLVRRRPGGGMPVAEYFKHNGNIPSFPCLEMHPMRFQNGPQKGTPDEKVVIASGTIVKLYKYQLESASDFRYVREALNQNLVSTVLPFRLMDYTVRPQRTGRRAQGVDERSLYGMEFMLLHRYSRDTSPAGDDEPIEEHGEDHHVGEVDHTELGNISIRAIVLKQLPGWLEPRRNTARVFHIVNGQVQFTENRAYLSANCKLSGLKDRVVIIVDASNLSEAAHNDVWKGDREKIRATGIGLLYRNQVTDVIKDSDFLKELQQQIAREETEQIAEQSRVDLFQDLVDQDPSIAQLLPGGTLVKIPGGIGRGKPEPEEWIGKYSPTFLELVGKRVRENGAEIAINGTRNVTFKTDVANNYLTRPDNKGRVLTFPVLGNKFSRTDTLRNGNLTIKFQAMENWVQPGDTMSFSVALLDGAMPEQVSADLTLRVVETRETDNGGGRNKGKGGSDDANGDTLTEQRALPPSKWLTRDGRAIGEDETSPWPPDFTEQDGGRVEDLGEGHQMYYINYDNAHFRRVLDSQRNEIDKKVVAEQYRMGMLVTMLSIEDAYARMPLDERKAELEEHIDDIRRLAAQGAATVMMAIAKTLPTIVNPASVTDPDD